MQPDKWDIEKLIAMCVQEEERLKSLQGDSANLVRDNKKNFNKNAKPQGKAPQNNHHQKNNNARVEKDQCKWCKKHEYYQRDCLDFLKSLLKRDEDFITFIDKFLFLSYAKSTWWIDSGVTIHVENSLQGFHLRKTLQRGERCIKVANGVEVEVEAIGELPLELKDGFVLKLTDVLYVPSLRRNLISVSRLDDDRFDCHFGNANVRLCLIISVLVLPSDKTSFICYHFMRM